MKTKTEFEIKEIAWPEKTFVTKRAKLKIDELPSFFGEAYGSIYAALKKAGVQANEPPCAIYYSVDETKKETDLAAAVPLHGLKKEIEGFENITIPQSKALTMTHIGPYENMGQAYSALEEYLTQHRLKKAWVIEEYSSDPAVEKDPAKWKTNIYFILKPE